MSLTPPVPPGALPGTRKDGPFSDLSTWPPRPTDHELLHLRKALDSGHWTDGPYTENVEYHLTVLTGAPHAVAFNSCTSAIHAALLAHRAHLHTDIAVPDFTFTGTVTGASHIRAWLHPVDVDPATLNLNQVPRDAEILLPVDLHGVPHTLPRTQTTTAIGSCQVVTDSCQALGSRINGEHIGAEGTHCWSFSSAKLVTAPDGGAVTTDDPDLWNLLREIRDYGIPVGTGPRSTGHARHPGGHNWRPTETTMSLVANRLGHVSRYAEAARHAAFTLHHHLDKNGYWRQTAPAHTQPAWHKIRIGHPSLRPDDTLRLEHHLNAHGIPTHRWGTPLRRHPAFAQITVLNDHDHGSPHYPVSNRTADATFCLGVESHPIHVWTDDEISYTCEILNQYGATL